MESQGKLLKYIVPSIKLIMQEDYPGFEDYSLERGSFVDGKTSYNTIVKE